MILSLETSTFSCSAAIHDSGRLLASASLHVSQSTASQLSVMVDQVSKVASVQPSQLKAVAVSAGPGSYTGLRIGVATAKGMCYGLNIPLIAVNSLDLLAAQVHPFNVVGAWLCPMFDARRMEVYTRLYNEHLQPQDDVQAKVIDELSFKDQLNGRQILFFGNGADKCKELIRHPNALFLEHITPSAEKLGELAFSKWQRNETEDSGRYEPFYLKDFIAKKPKALF